MRSGEGREAIARGPDKFRDATCGAAAQSQNADRQCEQILDAMVHLPKQKLLSLPRALELCDVPGDFRGADDLACFIFDRRNSDGNINKASVLALPYCLVVVNPLTATDTFEDHGFFVVPIGRNNHGHGPADGFLSRVAKEPMGPAVPTGDHALEIFRKDCVIR